MNDQDSEISTTNQLPVIPQTYLGGETPSKTSSRDEKSSLKTDSLQEESKDKEKVLIEEDKDSQIVRNGESKFSSR